MNYKYKNNKKVIANLVLIFGLMYAFNAFSDVTISNSLPSTSTGLFKSTANANVIILSVTPDCKITKSHASAGKMTLKSNETAIVAIISSQSHSISDPKTCALTVKMTNKTIDKIGITANNDASTVETTLNSGFTNYIAYKPSPVKDMASTSKTSTDNNTVNITTRKTLTVSNQITGLVGQDANSTFFNPEIDVTASTGCSFDTNPTIKAGQTSVLLPIKYTTGKECPLEFTLNNKNSTVMFSPVTGIIDKNTINADIGAYKNTNGEIKVIATQDTGQDSNNTTLGFNYTAPTIMIDNKLPAVPSGITLGTDIIISNTSTSNGSIPACHFSFENGALSLPINHGTTSSAFTIGAMDTSGQCSAQIAYGTSDTIGTAQNTAATPVSSPVIFTIKDHNLTITPDTQPAGTPKDPVYSFNRWNQHAAADAHYMIKKIFIKASTTANDYTLVQFQQTDLPFPLTPLSSATDNSGVENYNYLDNLVQAWWNNQSVVDWTNSDAVETAYEAGTITSLDIAKHMLIAAGMMDLYKNDENKFTYYQNLFTKQYAVLHTHALLLPGLLYHYIQPYKNGQTNTLSDLYINGAIRTALDLCNETNTCGSDDVREWNEDWSLYSFNFTNHDLRDYYKIITSGYNPDTAVESSYSRAALPFLYLFDTQDIKISDRISPPLNNTPSNVDFSAILKSTLLIEKQLIHTTTFIGAQSTAKNYRTDYTGDANVIFDETTLEISKVSFSPNQSFNSSTDDGLNIPFSLGAYLLTSQGDTTQKDNQEAAKIILSHEGDMINNNAWNLKGNKNIYTHFTGIYYKVWSFKQHTDTAIGAREASSYLLANLGLAVEQEPGKTAPSNSQQITSLTDRIKDILKSYTNSVPDDASNIILTDLYIDGAFNPNPYQNALIDHPDFRLDPNN